MMPSEIAQALDEMKQAGRISEWFVFDPSGDWSPQQNEWFITLSGARTSIKYNRREIEAFLLGASLL